MGGLSPPWDLDPPCLSPSKISVSPPFEIFNLIPPLRKKFIPQLVRFHSPTRKIFDFAKKVPIPPLDFDSPPIRDFGILSPTWKNFSPLVGKILRIAKRSQSPLWILTVPPLEILELYPPFGKILLPQLEKYLEPKKVSIPPLDLSSPPFRNFHFQKSMS